VYDGTRLALAEMLLGGTTCINDMCVRPASPQRGSSRAAVCRYFFPRASSAAVLSVGARAGE
jgi:hypothetical protein